MSQTAKPDRTGLSLEIFPPKKEEEFDNIFSFLKETAKLHPDFISCTYGAGGSRAGKTIEIASYIQKELKIDAIAHITCVGLPEKILRETAPPYRKPASTMYWHCAGTGPRI